VSRRIAQLVVLLTLAVALGASLIASDRRWGPGGALVSPIPYDGMSVRTGGELRILAAPSEKHWLGTDDRGRDVAARLVHGTRTALTLAAVAALAALGLALLMLVGVQLAPRPVRGAVLAACDVLASVPGLILAIAVQGALEFRGMLAVALVIAVPRAADGARVLHGAVEAVYREPWVAAARAVGAGRLRVLWCHALPSIAPVVAIVAAVTAATAVLSEAALTVLGLGVPPPTPSWGELLAQASENQLRWWLSVPSGLAVAILAWALFTLAQPAASRDRVS
jgi:peptide/nickel transport system permease protein